MDLVKHKVVMATIAIGEGVRRAVVSTRHAHSNTNNFGKGINGFCIKKVRTVSVGVVLIMSRVVFIFNITNVLHTAPPK